MNRYSEWEKEENGTVAQSNHGETKRVEILKDYLKRLGKGEKIESVRKDFVEEFQDVDPLEIMKAEQEMLQEGTPLEEVQKLCDVHAALFHGKTNTEKVANGEGTVNGADFRKERIQKAKILTQEKGHPLYLLTKENEALAKILTKGKEQVKAGEGKKEILEQIRDIATHYAKKGDLLYPLLKVGYGIAGPSDVMWTVDDEIRDEVSFLYRSALLDEKWQERLEAVLLRVEEMIYKEENILFPNCAANFTLEEWIGIYHDLKDYGECFGVQQENWEKGECNRKTAEPSLQDKEIYMPGGHMTVEQLTALFNTIPMEITFVDAENINCFFNEGPKDFKRPEMAIGREVFTCHPPKVEAKVRQIIESFRMGTLDEVPVWMEKNGKCMLVKYMAVRDRNKKYLGTLELVQNMEFAKEHFKG